MRLRTKILIWAGIMCLLLCMVTAGFWFTLFHRTAGDYFESNGARIFYTVEGAGPPVVLVHGVAANAGVARNPDNACLWCTVAKRSGDTAFTKHVSPQAKTVSPLRFATALHIGSNLRFSFLFFIGPMGR